MEIIQSGRDFEIIAWAKPESLKFFVGDGLETKCIGFAIGHITKRFVLVTDISVVPTYQRSGIGTALLEQLREEFKIPVHPVAPIEEAKEFWDHWLQKQGGEPVGQELIIWCMLMKDQPDAEVRPQKSVEK